MLGFAGNAVFTLGMTRDSTSKFHYYPSAATSGDTDVVATRAALVQKTITFCGKPPAYDRVHTFAASFTCDAIEVFHYLKYIPSCFSNCSSCMATPVPYSVIVQTGHKKIKSTVSTLDNPT
jgi:hypothetical protein